MAKRKKRKNGLIALVGAGVAAGVAGLVALVGGDAGSSRDLRKRMQARRRKRAANHDPSEPSDPLDPGSLGQIKVSGSVIVDPDAPPPRSGGDKPPPPRAPKRTDPEIPDVTRAYPTGASFYQVVKGDIFGGTNGTRSIAYRYLLTEAYLAATEIGGLDQEAARKWARSIANNPKRRVWVIDRIQCNGVNDATYGTYGFQAKGSSRGRPSEHGRAIRLLPQHAPNLARALQGQEPIRNIALGSPQTAGNGKALGVAPEDRGHFELLWLPGLNRQALWASGGTDLQLTKATWSDGTSKVLPPPAYMDLGIIDNTDTVEGRTWGCREIEQARYGD